MISSFPPSTARRMSGLGQHPTPTLLPRCPLLPTRDTNACELARAQSTDFSGARMNPLLSFLTARRPWSDGPALPRKPLIGGVVGVLLVCVALLCAARPAAAQFIQQGPALIGT